MMDRHAYYRSPKRKATRNRWRRANTQREMWCRAKARARKSDCAFTIKRRDIIIPTHCPVFGFVLVAGAGRGRSNSPSLDRVNSQRGYVRGNIQVISARANTLKRDATLKELEQLVRFLRRRRATSA